MADERDGLRADCSRCVGLCCVVPAFARSSDFAFAKPGRTPCRHLREDTGCGVHAELREIGMPGCTVYDCFGAGQHVVDVVLGGREPGSPPPVADAATTARLHAAYETTRDLHELLWHLAEVRSLPVDPALHDEADRLRSAVLAQRDGGEPVDTGTLQRDVGALLGAASAEVRAGHGTPRPPGDLVGARLRGRDLRGTDLRGALLLGADLREADLRLADLLGADLRGADLRGADLSTGLFLTRPQVAAARGDAATRLPAVLEHPGHWREVPGA